jgi:hypothetical protein
MVTALWASRSEYLTTVSDDEMTRVLIWRRTQPLVDAACAGYLAI